ncbi:ATP-binding protein [Clostridium sp. LBM24168]
MQYIDFQPNFKIRGAKLALKSISIYRNLLKDPVINKLYSLLDCMDGSDVSLEEVVDLYNGFFFELLQSGANSLESHMVDKIIFDENPFSKERLNIEKAVSNDLKNLQLAARISSTEIKGVLAHGILDNECRYVVEELPEWNNKNARDEDATDYIESIKEKFYSSDDWRKCIDYLKKFHHDYGYGIFARYRAFVWEHESGKGKFKSITDPDPIQLSDLIGYKEERSVVVENTLQFLNGFPANNVLLHGDRGTGKSSTVKAILNKYYSLGLRMIELPKAYLTDFPDIIRKLRNKPQKFIIFIDDLVFGDNEESYTALKSVLEGGLERRSKNILIYATSNRRHLVKEYFSDRLGSQDRNNEEEIHSGDSRQEKLSLADRFGINIVFVSPDKKKYLEIVDGIVKKRKLNIDRETLHREAVKWEMWYNGRSPRTAVQFVDWIEGHKSIMESEKI